MGSPAVTSGLHQGSTRIRRCSRWALPRPARVGESEAEVAGCALGECGRENWHLDVVVVVHFGGQLCLDGRGARGRRTGRGVP